jgi:hypothetical protein
MPEPPVLSNDMANRSDYRRTLMPALIAGWTSHVVERPFMAKTIAVNPPGA